jgi:sporulation protein YlmC with PRC-barrel domain
MRKRPLVFTSLAAFAVTSALAQQSPPQNMNPAPGGTSMSQPLEPGQFVRAPRPHQWRASKLIGLDVYGSDNEKIGDVSEILVDIDGREVVVLSVGGFLGIAGREVAVPFTAIEWRYGDAPRPTQAQKADPNASSKSGEPTARTTIDTTRRGYPDFAVLRTTAANLRSAPEFQYARD